MRGKALVLFGSATNLDKIIHDSISSTARAPIFITPADTGAEGTFKIMVSAQRHRIHSLEEMQKVIQEEWDELTEEDFRKCIESMPKRCKLVILARGGSIKY